MFEYLLTLDFHIFYKVHLIFINDFLDNLASFIRNKYTWFPLYVFIASFLVLNYKKKGIIIILFLIITIILSDHLSSHILKPFFERPRPCNIILTRDLIDCSNGYSFPSSHATNHFAIAFFLITYFKNQKIWLFPLAFLWAGAISYSQIYVGVHFPSDVIVGMFIGTTIGTIIAFFARQTNRLLKD